MDSNHKSKQKMDGPRLEASAKMETPGASAHRIGAYLADCVVVVGGPAAASAAAADGDHLVALGCSRDELIPRKQQVAADVEGANSNRGEQPDQDGKVSSNQVTMARIIEADDMRQPREENHEKKDNNEDEDDDDDDDANDNDEEVDDVENRPLMVGEISSWEQSTSGNVELQMSPLQKPAEPPQSAGPLEPDRASPSGVNQVAEDLSAVEEEEPTTTKTTITTTTSTSVAEDVDDVRQNNKNPSAVVVKASISLMSDSSSSPSPQNSTTNQYDHIYNYDECQDLRLSISKSSTSNGELSFIKSLTKATPITTTSSQDTNNNHQADALTSLIERIDRDLDGDYDLDWSSSRGSSRFGWAIAINKWKYIKLSNSPRFLPRVKYSVKQEITQINLSNAKNQTMIQSLEASISCSSSPISSTTSSSSSSSSTSTARVHSDDGESDPNCNLFFRSAPKPTKTTSPETQNIVAMLEHLTRRREELRLIDRQLLDMMSDCLGQLTWPPVDTSLEFAQMAAANEHCLPVSMIQQAVDLSMATNRARGRADSLGYASGDSSPSSASVKFNSKKKRLLDAVEADERLMVLMNNTNNNQSFQCTDFHSASKKFKPLTSRSSLQMSDDLIMPINYAQQQQQQQQQLDRLNLNYIHQQQPPASSLTSQLPSPGASKATAMDMIDRQLFGGQQSAYHQQLIKHQDVCQSSGGLSSSMIMMMSSQHQNHDYPQQQPIPLDAYVLSSSQQQQQANNLQQQQQQQQVAADSINNANGTTTSKQTSLSTKDTLELVRATICQTGSNYNNDNNNNSIAIDQQLRQQQLDRATNLIAPIVQKMSFRCHVCGSGFEDRHRLQQHLSIHLNLHSSWFEEKTIKETMAQYELRRGDYWCQICQYRFETTAEFDKHMQLHGEKPHQCELCSQQDNNKFVSFRYFRQLLTHLRSHCFLYSCRFVPECKQTANRKDYLKLHILKHHLNNKLPEQYTICCH